jgi:hypothetical protein
MMPPMSRHRFDHSVDHSDDTKDASAAARPRRIEVITGIERRRKWSAQEKAAIVTESLAEGAVVSEVARRMVSIRNRCSAGAHVYAMP